jgi:hypothetical protein
MLGTIKERYFSEDLDGVGKIILKRICSVSGYIHVTQDMEHGN